MTTIRVDKNKVLKAALQAKEFYQKNKARRQEAIIREMMKPRPTWFGLGKPKVLTQEQALQRIMDDFPSAFGYADPHASAALDKIALIETMCKLTADEHIHISAEDCKLLGNFLNGD
jgi:hypothetical protein